MPLRAPFDKLADQRDEERHRPVAPSRRRDCHFADALSPSILKLLIQVQGVQQNDRLADYYL